MSLSAVGTANIDWAKLSFSITDSSVHFRMTWRQDSGWGEGELVHEPYIRLHVMANVLHYGQSIFEGQKVFQCKDGKVRIFCDTKNWERMTNGAERMGLPTMSLEQWQKAVDTVVQANLGFVPPYGSGASMYLRPVLFGSGPQVALHTAEEVTFLIVCMPVGSYYKSGSLQPIEGVIMEDTDRAAPNGVGNVKAAGNYAADMVPAAKKKKLGFPIGLYLDPREGRYIEEFNTSNFVAISRDGRTYITPQSSSILPSVTNWCLEQLAKDEGLEVDRRRVDVEELETFSEVGAVGTAVVITAIKSLTRTSDNKVWEFTPPDVLQRLHDKVRGIQIGEEEDVHGWCREVVCEA